MDTEEIRRALDATGRKRERALKLLDESRNETEQLVPIARQADITWREIGVRLGRDGSAVQRETTRRATEALAESGVPGVAG